MNTCNVLPHTWHVFVRCKCRCFSIGVVCQCASDCLKVSSAPLHGSWAVPWQGTGDQPSSQDWEHCSGEDCLISISSYNVYQIFVSHFLDWASNSSSKLGWPVGQVCRTGQTGFSTDLCTVHVPAFNLQAGILEVNMAFIIPSSWLTCVADLY